MKGKYMTTSLLLAVMASEKTANLLHVAETKAATDNHQLIWNKDIPSARQLRARIADRDELKFA